VQRGIAFPISLRFQKKLAKVNSASWLLATSEDFREPNVSGGTPDQITRFMQRYVDQIVALSTERPQCATDCSESSICSGSAAVTSSANRFRDYSTEFKEEAPDQFTEKPRGVLLIFNLTFRILLY